jgi:hypothetical protein
MHQGRNLHNQVPILSTKKSRTGLYQLGYYKITKHGYSYDRHCLVIGSFVIGQLGRPKATPMTE